MRPLLDRHAPEAQLAEVASEIRARLRLDQGAEIRFDERRSVIALVSSETK